MPYSRDRRASRGDLPLTRMVPVVGTRRWPGSRNSVLLPQPDGPMSETNAPERISRVMCCSARIDCPASEVANVIDTSSSDSATSPGRRPISCATSSPLAIEPAIVGYAAERVLDRSHNVLLGRLDTGAPHTRY